jgi:hypothetical protein
VVIGTGRAVLRKVGIAGINETFLDEALLDVDCDIFVNGAGVRLLLLDAEFGKQVEDAVWFDLELPR